MAHKYGPPGGKVKTPAYYRHMGYCRYHGVDITYAEYLARVGKGSKYGPPGCSSNDPDAARHRVWCQRNGLCTWDEYVQRSPRYAAEMEPERIAERVARNRAKFAHLLK